MLNYNKVIPVAKKGILVAQKENAWTNESLE